MNQTIARIIGILIAIAEAFFASNPVVQSVVNWLAQFETSLGQTSGTIPPFKLGTTWYGPIPFGQTEPPPS